ncbi:MAG: polynucleotide adenylyltransferase-domain containing protein [Chloroflexi bacterium OLB14]|nr:MAG: polynucleotide adenylyltransferase-domain containing protein [Chloroflexi bacterium OLB14]
MQKDLHRLLHDPILILPEVQTLISNIASLATELNIPCYLVGGIVRDLLLNLPIHDSDLDFVFEGDAIKFGESLVKKYGGKLTHHYKFHTAIWHLPQTLDLRLATVDLITARKESYQHAGALPTVTSSTIDDDLHRRDFPINSMAIRLDGDHFGQLLDPLNGGVDLENKIIKVLHDKSFIDDPTRIFRAIRYETRYSFNLEPSTLNLINAESLSVLSKLSGERIRNELDLIFDEEKASQIILRVAKLGILNSIHIKLPEFKDDYSDYLDMDSRLDIPADRRTMGYMLWFMDLSEEEVFSICNRLDFSNELTLAVWSAAQLKRSLPHLTDSKPSVWAYALEKLPLLSIYAVYLVSGEDSLLSYLSIWRHVKPHTTGEDLKKTWLETWSAISRNPIPTSYRVVRWRVIY